MPLTRTMCDQVTELIRCDVLAGRFEVATSLREVPLAKRYGVSRGRIRDALLRLTQEGLLVGKPNCGVRVGGRFDEAFQPLIVSLRRKIEVFALHNAVVKMTETDIDRMDASVKAMRRACEKRDLSRIVECDIAFHRQIVEAVGDPDLVSIWLPVVSRMIISCNRHASNDDSWREHEAIAHELRKRDLLAAQGALLNNIR